MMTLAGYIDVLHIAPASMAIFSFLVTLAVWLVSYLLLRLYGREGKKGNHVKT
jgi:hypothetical protein